MRTSRFLFASLAVAGLALPFATPCLANVLIAIDKGTQSMSVSVDGVPRYQWAVSTGRAGYNTPSGAFRPNRMEAIHYSKEYEDAPMPHSIFFDMNGHAIHGFFDTPHLGMAVSHGCVRLSPAHAATLYELVKAEGMANTRVVISGHIPSRGAPLVAERQAPPASGYDRQPDAPQGQAYGAPSPAYGQQPYGQDPEPYNSPAYGQAYGNGQSYYARPAFGPPVFGSPAYERPYSPFSLY
jgi:L,D-transpeptidase catalytic domain